MSISKTTISIICVAFLLTTFTAYNKFHTEEAIPSSEKLKVQEGNVEVILTDEGYIPSVLKIKKGTTLTFRTERDKPHWPASNLHPSHKLYSEFDPKRPLNPDETWSFTFERVGQWDFHDHIRAYYTGTIYVVQK